ncbi:MAG: HNH endonuclease [Magnetococcales bacterium]|nr:HNH endonuclease [Magnetococcales bacterium]
MSIDDLFIAADPEVTQRERLKAKELKRSAWLKGQTGQGRCHYCGARCHPGALTMDHVVPLIRGGRTTRGNCVPACMECNQEKRHLSSLQWQSRMEEKRLKRAAEENAPPRTPSTEDQSDAQS